MPINGVERARLEIVLDELTRLEPWGPVTGEALGALRTRYQSQLQELNRAFIEAPARDVSSAGDLGPVVPVATALDMPSPREPVPALEPKAAFSLAEFLADRSILIVSYVGAFLLIVATLLFEIYGAESLGGFGRFSAVLALDLVFGGAAWVCLRTPKLRLVGTTYLAIAALLAPLVLIAAYVFLVLRDLGITIPMAQAAAGVSCTILYGILAVKLRSTGYAVLSMVSLLVGWTGALTTLQLDSWRGAGLVPLLVLFSFGAHRWALLRSLGPRVTSAAAWFTHGTAGLALAWTVLGGLDEAVGFRGIRHDAVAPALWVASVTLAGLAGGYAFHGWAGRKWQVAPLIAILATLSALAATEALNGGPRAASLLLLGLAWLYAVLARVLPRAVQPNFLRGLAAVQALLCALVLTKPEWLHLLILLAGSALGVVLARDSARPAWLWLTGVLVSAAWYWLVKIAVPPPPEPSFLGLLLAYAPLPVLLAGAAWTTSRRVARRWAEPVYLVAAINATWIVLSLLAEEEGRIAGWVLLVYALVTYAAGTAERFWPAIAAALVLLAGGVLSLLGAADASVWAYPLGASGAFWVVYAAGEVWTRSRFRSIGDEALSADPWLRTHRLAPLAGMALTAITCFLEPDFYRAGDPAPLAALGAAVALALMLLAEGRRRRDPLWQFGAGGVLALSSFWVARYLGAENPQWYVVTPGVALLWAGTRAPSQPLVRGNPGTYRSMVALGLMLLLGTSALQSFEGGGLGAIYLSLLVVEGVASLLLGIGLRQRTPVVGGAAALALAALRALFLILQRIPLFAVFGVVALLLLGGAAALAFLRDRAGKTKSAVAGWADWR
jgi:hypothetical protein